MADEILARARMLAKVAPPRKAAAGYRTEKTFVRQPAADVQPLQFTSAPPADRREAIAALAAPLIKKFEGFRANAYLDDLAKPPLWTVGYGTTKIGGEPVAPSTTVSEYEALEHLKNDMAWAIEVALTIESRASVRLTEAQCAALTSWAYNVGSGAALRSKIVTGRIRAGNLQGAADGLLAWNKAGGRVLRGLTRRREAERALFLSESVSSVEPVDAARATPDAPEKPLAKSTSVWAGLTGAGAWGLDLIETKFALFSKLTGLPGVAGAVLMAIALAAFAWMIAERVRKHRIGGEVGG